MTASELLELLPQQENMLQTAESQALVIALYPLIQTGALAPRAVLVNAKQPKDADLIKQYIGSFPVIWGQEIIENELKIQLRIPDGWSQRDLISAYYQSYQGKLRILMTEEVQLEEVFCLSYTMEIDTGLTEISVYW